MGMSGLVLDNVDKFWDLANTSASECEDIHQYATNMREYIHLLSGSADAENVEFRLYEIWNDTNK